MCKFFLEKLKNRSPAHGLEMRYGLESRFRLTTYEEQ